MFWRSLTLRGYPISEEQGILNEAFNVRRYGAVGDGKTKDTRAIAATIEACAKSGGGTVYFPPGAYLSGSIELVSHMSLYLDAGATILGSEDYDDYPLRSMRVAGVVGKFPAPLIFGRGLTHISIKGQGTIDGQGQVWWDRFRRWHDKELRPYLLKGLENLTAKEKKDFKDAESARPGRPRLIGLTECDRVLLQGVTLCSSPSWTVHLLFCRNITVDNISVHNPHDSWNTDGINLDSCSSARITNCHIDVGDDCITIKSGLDEDGRRVGIPCQQVVISNCTMAHGHGGVVIGSEMSGGVRDISASNCVFCGTDTGIRLKTKRGRGNVVENVSFSNIVMSEVGTAMLIDMHYACGGIAPPEPVSERTPIFRNIAISNVTIRDAEKAGEFKGLPEMPFEGLSLSNIAASAKEGIILENAKDVTFDRVRVKAKQGPLLACDNVEDLTVLDSFRVDQANRNGPLIKLARVRGVYLRRSGDDSTKSDLVELR